ncbi:hypothetical protein KJ966_15525 [bacterium]|nr:hypothetical protein [bacterium]
MVLQRKMPLKKTERVTKYLNDLYRTNPKKFSKLTYGKLCKMAEFSDIGENTLRKCTVEFKAEHSLGNDILPIKKLDFERNKPLKKFDQITNFLNNLFQTDKKKLRKLDLKELCMMPEFSKIGERTIYNAFNEFKAAHPDLYPQELKVIKKNLVLDYLNRLKKDDAKALPYLSSRKLLAVPELKGVGKTTIVTTLSEYKKVNPRFFSGKKSNLKKTEKSIRERNKRPAKQQRKQNFSKQGKVYQYMEKLKAKLSPEKLYDLKAADISSARELQGIGATSISSVLSDYKRDFFVGCANEIRPGVKKRKRKK